MKPTFSICFKVFFLQWSAAVVNIIFYHLNVLYPSTCYSLACTTGPFVIASEVHFERYKAHACHILFSVFAFLVLIPSLT